MDYFYNIDIKNDWYVKKLLLHLDLPDMNLYHLSLLLMIIQLAPLHSSPSHAQCCPLELTQLSTGV